MANELLDFVMSLVRDPDAAARYAENPDQTIHDANLVNVTSTDVSNLIPVVSESLSASVPTAGTDGVVHDVADNVWTSGAATAAFDAFDDHLPVQSVDDAHAAIADYSNVIDNPDPALHSDLDTYADAGVHDVVAYDDAPLHLDQPIIDDAPIADVHTVNDIDHTIAGIADMDSDPSGLDLF
jgi:hypothetical protein